MSEKDMESDSSTCDGNPPERRDITKELEQKPFMLPGFGGNANKVVVLSHGFTASPPTIRPLANAINKQGYAVIGVLLPGHGTTLEDMRMSCEAQWFGELERVFLEARAEYEKVAIGGLSLGGTLAARVAEKHEADALLMYAPAFKLKHLYQYIGYFFHPIMKYIKFDPKHRKARVNFLEEYGIGYNGVPLEKLRDLIRTAALARQALPNVKCPVFSVASLTDEQVSPKICDLIEQALPNSTLIRLADSPHVCVLGHDREHIFDETIKFLKDNLR